MAGVWQDYRGVLLTSSVKHWLSGFGACGVPLAYRADVGSIVMPEPNRVRCRPSATMPRPTPLPASICPTNGCSSTAIAQTIMRPENNALRPPAPIRWQRVRGNRNKIIQREGLPPLAGNHIDGFGNENYSEATKPIPPIRFLVFGSELKLWGLQAGAAPFSPYKNPYLPYSTAL